MTPGALLEALEARGIRLCVRGGYLKYEAPAGAYTEQIRALVAEHRAELVAGWRCWRCGAITRVLFGIGPIVRCRPCATHEDGRAQEARRWWVLFKEEDRGRDDEAEAGARV